jgi:hypothetical protein
MSALEGPSEQSVSPPEFATLHKWLIRVCVVFFVWLVVEGAALVPYLIAHFGWW